MGINLSVGDEYLPAKEWALAVKIDLTGQPNGDRGHQPPCPVNLNLGREFRLRAQYFPCDHRSDRGLWATESPWSLPLIRGVDWSVVFDCIG